MEDVGVFGLAGFNAGTTMFITDEGVEDAVTLVVYVEDLDLAGLDQPEPPEGVSADARRIFLVLPVEGARSMAEALTDRADRFDRG